MVVITFWMIAGARVVTIRQRHTPHLTALAAPALATSQPQWPPLPWGLGDCSGLFVAIKIDKS